MEIKNFLLNILKNSISFFDTRENFYHGLMLGMLVMTSDYYKIQSNKEEGYGRFDIRLMPRDKSNKAIIIELKASNKGEKLKSLAAKALKQIEEKEYYSSLSKENCSGILEYGIAFAKKNLEIEYKKKDFKVG